MHDAVDDGHRELVVHEEGVPPAELDVGGEYHAPSLVALGYHLVQQPRAVDVEGHVAELPYHVRPTTVAPDVQFDGAHPVLA